MRLSLTMALLWSLICSSKVGMELMLIPWSILFPATMSGFAKNQETFACIGLSVWLRTLIVRICSFLLLLSSFHFLHIEVPFPTLTPSVIFLLSFSFTITNTFKGQLDNLFIAGYGGHSSLQMANNGIEELVHI